MILAAITYENEHLLFGHIGQLAIYISFVFAIITSVAYGIATKYRRQVREATPWLRLGQLALWIHGISTLAVIGILFHLMIQKYYEYAYVYQHTSDELPFRYIFSAFWGGQEGSFLLWAFWHVVLALLFQRVQRQWEAPVLSILALVQTFIMSMLLGVYLSGGAEPIKIGISPFVLLRDTFDAPIFTNADYLSLIEGRGLNALLQNYWMTIHPPTLFLGFASTTIPFAFAFGALWVKDYQNWLGPCFRWSAFSAFILGVGIWMGGAWAYEALTFGGYWAWDPVENMSLVPWLILVAGLHSHLVARATGHSLRATYVFYLLTFTMIVYSTFLVRSGILEDTSVHAFVESGLEKQLTVFLLFFPLVAFTLFAWRYRHIPSPQKEETIGSREFWMFLGAMILTISSFLITMSTSLPLFNTIMEFFDPLYEGKVIEEPVSYYNQQQLWIAIFIAAASGVAQWLRYRERSFASYIRSIRWPLGLAALASIGLTLLLRSPMQVVAWQYQILLGSSIFAILLNGAYMLKVFRRQPKAISGVLSHIGFGIMVLGILLSGLSKETISTNVFAQDGLLGMDKKTLQSNIILLQGAPIDINGYRATYVNDTIEGRYRTYQILFESLTDSSEVFTLSPNIIYNQDFTKVEAYNPSTYRKLSYDIFSHISALPEQETNFKRAQEIEDSLTYKTIYMHADSAVSIGDYRVRSWPITGKPRHPEYHYKEGDQTAGLWIEIEGGALQAEKDTIETLVLLRDGFLYQYAGYYPKGRIKFKLPESFADLFFKPDKSLSYEMVEMSEGGSASWNGYELQFEGVNLQPTESTYKPREGDIALSVSISFAKNGRKTFLQPIYYIRDKQQFNIPAHTAQGDIYARLVGIHPNQSSFTFALADGTSALSETYPVQVAENVPRSDYIVLQATKFPGINFFWLGSILMLSGLLTSLILRWRNK